MTKYLVIRYLCCNFAPYLKINQYDQIKCKIRSRKRTRIME